VLFSCPKRQEKEIPKKDAPDHKIPRSKDRIMRREAVLLHADTLISAVFKGIGLFRTDKIAKHRIPLFYAGTLQ